MQEVHNKNDQVVLCTPSTNVPFDDGSGLGEAMPLVLQDNLPFITMDYGFEINGILGMNFLINSGAIINLKGMHLQLNS